MSSTEAGKLLLACTPNPAGCLLPEDSVLSSVRDVWAAYSSPLFKVCCTVETASRHEAQKQANLQRSFPASPSHLLGSI